MQMMMDILNAQTVMEMESIMGFFRVRFEIGRLEMWYLFIATLL
jgi:hypothetical protein